MVASSNHRGTFRPPRPHASALRPISKAGKHHIIGSRSLGGKWGGGAVVFTHKSQIRSRDISIKRHFPAAEPTRHDNTYPHSTAGAHDHISSDSGFVPSLSLITQPDERAQGYGWQICDPTEASCWDDVGHVQGSIFSFLREQSPETETDGPPQVTQCSTNGVELDESSDQAPPPPPLVVCSSHSLHQDIHRRSVVAPVSGG